MRLAARHTFSSLGPIGVVLKEEPSPRQALDALCRYLTVFIPLGMAAISIRVNGDTSFPSGNMMDHRATLFDLIGAI